MSTLRGPAQLADLQGTLCVPTQYSYTCVRAGANLRPNLEKHLEKYLVPIYLSLRLRRKHPFSVDFPILQIFRTDVRLHMQCTYLTVGESCIDQDLWPTSGYHKQWPEAWRINRAEKRVSVICFMIFFNLLIITSSRVCSARMFAGML